MKKFLIIASIFGLFSINETFAAQSGNFADDCCARFKELCEKQNKQVIGECIGDPDDAERPRSCMASCGGDLGFLEEKIGSTGGFNDHITNGKKPIKKVKQKTNSTFYAKPIKR